MESLRFIASDAHIAPLLVPVGAGGVEPIEEMSAEDRVRLKASSDSRVTGTNDALYQGEIGILDDPEVIAATHITVSELMPLWLALGCRVSSRVDQALRDIDSP